MSIAIDPVQKTSTRRPGSASLVPPAEVWDVGSTPPNRCSVGGVRTLSGKDRNNERSSFDRRTVEAGDARSFESWREKRDTLLLGICMTTALLLGSALGGVFSGEPGGAVGGYESDGARAVSAAIAR